MNLPQIHRLETEKLIRGISDTDEGKKEIARWILEDGYYPEPYVLPPCFKISGFELQQKKFEKKKYTQKKLEFQKLSDYFIS